MLPNENISYRIFFILQILEPVWPSVNVIKLFYTPVVGLSKLEGLGQVFLFVQSETVYHGLALLAVNSLVQTN